MAGEIWVSAAGLQARSQEIETLANDVANVDTTGFKALLPDPTDTAPLPAYPAGLSVGPATPLDVFAGGGAAPSPPELDVSEGPLVTTGRSMDAAILGQGFFALRDPANPAGAPVYARAGRFFADSAGHVVDADGRSLLGADGNPLRLPLGARDPRILSDGTVTADTASGPVTAGRIGLAYPTNAQGLVGSGFGVWAQSASTGSVPLAVPDGKRSRLQVGALEQSNTDLSTVLPQLLSAQRAYEANSRALNVGLQLWTMSNQLRG